MSRWAVEFVGGVCVDVEARSEYWARKYAIQNSVYRGLEIVEVRPFTAKVTKKPNAGKMPTITVKENPFDKLKTLLD